MKNYLELMLQIDLIKSIDPQEIESSLTKGSCKIAEYGKNNIVHFVGEVCSKLEIILAGKVVIERIDESGNRMTIAEFFSEDVLGGNLMFSKNPCGGKLPIIDDYFEGGEIMSDYPNCKSCGAKMTEYDGCSWYTCPECGQAIRDNENGSWTWRDEIFGRGSKHHKSDFDLADFCRGGELSED